MAILVAPFVVLTLVPLLAHAAGLLGRSVEGGLAAASTLNAAMASLDLFGALLLYQQVPSSAEVRNKGWQTYWRVNAA